MCSTSWGRQDTDIRVSKEHFLCKHFFFVQLPSPSFKHTLLRSIRFTQMIDMRGLQDLARQSRQKW